MHREVGEAPSWRSRAIRPPIQRFRETEIEHLDGAVVAHFDVRRFQVAMDDALVVSDFERFGNLAGDRQRFVDRNRARREAIGQRGAVDELHDERHVGPASSTP